MTGAEKMNKTIKIRVLYNDGCPNASKVVNLIEKVKNEVGVPVFIESVVVSSQEQAVKLRCLGSPTIQINGLDIDRSARDSVAFGLG